MHIFRTLIACCLLVLGSLHPVRAADTKVDTVYIVFKTHLDVGFTDLSSVVTRNYVEHFIPQAMDVAEQLEQEGRGERYVWTTGSWLIYEYLRTATPEQRARLEKHLRRGNIVWNAMPYTVESETLTLPLFRTLLNLSRRLDSQYGRHTTAAKMTDVPGHTRAIVNPLSEAGIRMLHIGVNPASAVPAVPTFCRWCSPEGRELVFVYQPDYGTEDVLPDGRSVLSVNFTGDNHGPHSAGLVKEIYARLRQKYPDACLVACSLSEVADKLWTLRARLPVVTSEIGDTWIYGYGTAPQRMARYRRLAALYGSWVEQGKIDPESDAALRFALQMGLVAEHTQGMDVKTHLGNWDKYLPADFQKARSTEPFRKVEQSWREIDDYLDSAVVCLPAKLQAEARRAMADADKVEWQEGRWKPAQATTPWHFEWPGGGLQVGPLTYEMLDADDYEDFFSRYMRGRYGWALADLGKPGLENTGVKGFALQAYADSVSTEQSRRGVRHTALLSFRTADALAQQVLPRRLQVSIFLYKGERKADVSLTWIDKPAVRLPESYWLSFPTVGTTGAVAEKVGSRIDLFDVVERGARQLHGIDRYVDVQTAQGTWRVTSTDALLAQWGEPKGLAYSTEQPSPRRGNLHFNLANNLWGTNFSMWNEGSETFRFTVERLP